MHDPWQDLCSDRAPLGCVGCGQAPTRLPNAVTQVGTYPEEIFAGYHEVQNKVGTKEMENIPFGAIAAWTLADKLAAGLQQFMAGARKFNLSEIDRSDLMSANRETEDETGITYMTSAQNESALSILKG